MSLVIYDNKHWIDSLRIQSIEGPTYRTIKKEFRPRVIYDKSYKKLIWVKKKLVRNKFMSEWETVL